MPLFQDTQVEGRVRVVRRTCVSSQDRGITRLLVLRGQNSDSDKYFMPPSVAGELGVPHVDDAALYDLLVECRVRKVRTEKKQKTHSRKRWRMGTGFLDDNE